MLQTIHLTKTYKPKHGVPVKAVDDVSLTFPETGMVFLLGKSGSGKSTLLNLLGGLDVADGGEIVIKGVSSKTFRQMHFDSYRNTYVGFIFQEYNVLEDFTVGANIALAIELQGRKATDEEINRILTEVDLAGFGNRHPNELSGGQKQRVAIARALVKNPEIIMADEPTGALDSATGRQVLETLKRLSADKLVVVVSHDREFAEKYADRIIELSDGQVLRDVEADGAALPVSGGLVYGESGISIPDGYRLTEEDRLAINAYLDGLKDRKDVHLMPAALTGRRFRETSQETAPREDGSAFKLIKSRLPVKNAFKIGAGGLKHKKFRLVMTVILSCIAFGLFGLADTMTAYNQSRVLAKSLVDTGLSYVSLEYQLPRTFEWDDSVYYYGVRATKAQVEELEKVTGLSYVSMYSPGSMNLSIKGTFNSETEWSETMYNIYVMFFRGFVELTEKSMNDLGLKLLAGSLPDGTAHQIAVSEHAVRTWVKGGFLNEDGTYAAIRSAVDVVGRTVTLDGEEYVITGVVDTGFNFDRYADLMKENKNASESDSLIEMFLYQEYAYEDEYGLSAALFVGEGFNDLLRAKLEAEGRATSDVLVYLYNNFDEPLEGMATWDIYQPEHLVGLDRVDLSQVQWLGEPREALGDREIILSENLLVQYVIHLEGAGSYYYEVADLNLDELAAAAFDMHYSAMLAAGSLGEVKVVGILPYGTTDNTVVLPSKLLTEASGDPDAIYSCVIGRMPETVSDVEELATRIDSADLFGGSKWEMQNSVAFELRTVTELFEALSKVFFYVGLGFAVFAAVLLGNFIATSIAYKKQEIGILRAIGSRSMDVFRIFFSESFIIAMINFVLSALGTLAICSVINLYFRKTTGLLISIMSFGLRQVGLLLLVSLVVAAVASFFPVRRIAAKRPIDAIRGR